MSEPEFVAETLAWCNERRAEKGLPPLDRLPKGERKNPYSCPCGKSTGLSVSEDAYCDGDDDDGALLPEVVSKFVRAFDAGHLPQYDEALS